jgi:hypothetical protein
MRTGVAVGIDVQGLSHHLEGDVGIISGFCKHFFDASLQI